MKLFINPQVPAVSPGDVNYFIYVMLIALVFLFVFMVRKTLPGRAGFVFFVFLLLAILQRILIIGWYLLTEEYDPAYSLPLQICRVVVWLVILQFFIRRDFLNQIIFYMGLFSYGAFFYPIGIYPPWHMAGWAFFLLHGINTVFPFAMHFAVGFIPTFKGLLQAYIVFLIYFFLVYSLNPHFDGNYFFIEQRPFFHELGASAYILVNLAGTFFGFLFVYLIVKGSIRLKYRASHEEEA
ncbi:YwaF family protein [Salinicoccus bachuensis]|uniref:YwaF family protein n=1 Tax=Salinicoccus bachuensis TaxID=3136731 RepID=A0ABZ3CJX0_9STAP